MAHKPWRALEAERGLESQQLEREVLAQAAAAAMHDAKLLRDNAFKVEFGRRRCHRHLFIDKHGP